MLHSSLPDWMHEGGPGREYERLRSPEDRARVRAEWAARMPAWERLTVGSVRTEPNRWMEGRTLGALIAESGKDAVDFVCDLLLAEDLAVSHVSAAGGGEDDLIALLLHPYSMIGSDGLLLGGSVHPRTYGTFPRVLQRYVREQRVLTLEAAIRKLASFPAQRLGIPDRGLVKEGMRADLVVFDPDTVTERATFERPCQFATGIPHVAINGTLVVDNGRHTGATPGQAVRHRLTTSTSAEA